MPGGGVGRTVVVRGRGTAVTVRGSARGTSGRLVSLGLSTVPRSSSIRFHSHTLVLAHALFSLYLYEHDVWVRLSQCESIRAYALVNNRNALR